MHARLNHEVSVAASAGNENCNVVMLFLFFPLRSIQSILIIIVYLCLFPVRCFIFSIANTPCWHHIEINQINQRWKAKEMANENFQRTNERKKNMLQK